MYIYDASNTDVQQPGIGTLTLFLKLGMVGQPHLQVQCSETGASASAVLGRDKREWGGEVPGLYSCKCSAYASLL